MKPFKLAALLVFTTAPVMAAPSAKAPNQSKAPASATVSGTASAAPVISAGNKVSLAEYLLPERPTVFVFYKPSSSMERSFVADLQSDVQGAIGFGLIQLKSGEEAVARQYEIKETPTAIIYDRRGRIVDRSSDAETIRTAIGKAARVMRIDWAEEGDPRLEAAREMLGQRQIPGILRTMTLQPDYLRGFIMMSIKAQFTDGYLDRRTKELIATYVSAINKCKY